MLRISWTQKVSNVRGLQRVARSRELLLITKTRKVQYLGHVLRDERYQLFQLIMMGKVEGKRRVKRRKKSWLRNIHEWTIVSHFRGNIVSLGARSREVRLADGQPTVVERHKERERERER
ncbi:jg27540 [Pararge aegeria aegeria]|uniref:Jg27540 protein n=1 Tax=Pararge aegeria aegeria TaxID=348720 RepID=A0A8S4SKY9_9NEOP|nr:jg27540 [Pararge aegeria aegeria]